MGKSLSTPQHGTKNIKTHNKTSNLLQTSGGKDEPNIVYMGKSLSTPQHGTKNIKTHNKT